MTNAWAAVVALWIRLHPPSYGPGFESQAQNLGFSIFIAESNVTFEAFCTPFKAY